MKDLIVITAIVVILVSALGYIVREKKRGAKCIGCPYAKTCGQKDCGCK